MKNCWSDEQAEKYVALHRDRCAADLALRAYASRLVGAEPSLVLHGGGNSSLKGSRRNILGEDVAALFVKPSGFDMASMEPEDYVPLDLDYLLKMRALDELSDEQMAAEFRSHSLDRCGVAASIESLVHAFIPKKYLDHCHADAILALTNQADGAGRIVEALGPRVPVLPYVKPGFRLAQAAARCFEANPGSTAMVWMRHGLLTWGDTARASYEMTVELISLAEEYIARRSRRAAVTIPGTPLDKAFERLQRAAPVVRGLLAAPTEDPDRPYRRVILQPFVTREVLDILDSEGGRELTLSPPLTSDHLIRTKPLPLWLDHPDFENLPALRAQLSQAVRAYTTAYDAYFERNAARMPSSVPRTDSLPRVVLIPGLGALCAGKDAFSAGLARDITAHTLSVKTQVAAMGRYSGMEEAELFDMEYRVLQHAKLGSEREPALGRQVALITGAAGAIGWGIAEELLAEGCHVAVTDLPGENLNSMADSLRARFGKRVIAVPLDVTDPESVAAGFGQVVREWGGVDLVVVNAGVALVSSAGRDATRIVPETRAGQCRRNAARARRSRRGCSRLQGTGGDIVLVSTKNVFAPGATLRRLQRHQVRRAPTRPHRQPGVRRARGAGQHGLARRGVLPTARRKSGPLGRRSGPTG